MKNLLKVLVLSMSAILMLALVIGCDHDSGSNPGKKTQYTLSADAETLELTVGAGNGTVNVTTNGNFTIEMENSSVATASKEGKVVTVVPVSKGTTILVITCTEDSSKSVEIPVNVILNTATLTLTLADEIAVPGGSITVSYGNEDTEGLEYQTVTAVVSADGKTATCEISPDLANAWGWFNGIVITVKNSNGEDVPVSYTAYFEYNADGMALDVAVGIVSKTFTLAFENIEIPGGSVNGLKYTAVDNDWENATEPEVTVSEDGKSATFTVLKSGTNNSSWFQLNLTSIELKTASNAAVTVNGGIDEDKWFDYNAEMTHTISFIELTDADYTGLIADNIAVPSDITEIVAASALTGINAKAIKITYTVGANDVLNTSETWITIYSDSNWSHETKLVNAWNSTMRESDEEGNTYSVYITNSSDVAVFLAGGFFAASDPAEYTGKISINYVPGE